MDYCLYDDLNQFFSLKDLSVLNSESIPKNVILLINVSSSVHELEA